MRRADFRRRDGADRAACPQRRVRGRCARAAAGRSGWPCRAQKALQSAGKGLLRCAGRFAARLQRFAAGRRRDARPADAFTKRPSADLPDADPLVCASLRAVFRHGRVPRGVRASLAAARRAGRLCGAFAFLQLDGWAFSAAGRWRPLPRSERTAQPFSLFARADALSAASGIGNACACAERRLFRAARRPLRPGVPALYAWWKAAPRWCAHRSGGSSRR